MKSNINIELKEYKQYLLNIKELFNYSSKIIYNGRNVIKEIKIDNQLWSVKSFSKPKNINRIIYSFFRDSKAKRSFEYSLRISEFVPEPLGYIEFYNSKILTDSYFISKSFDYDFTIREILFNKLDNEKIEILKDFAKFSYKLHQNSIEHLDYSPGNILIKKDANGYIFKIVDINRMKFHSLDLQQRAINFARVWLRDEDMEIIIREYAKIASFSYQEMLKFALYHSRQHKYNANFKKKLKDRIKNVRNK